MLIVITRGTDEEAKGKLERPVSFLIIVMIN